MTEHLPTKLTLDQISRLCQRALGGQAQIVTLNEYGGGTFNETYHVELSGDIRMVLRAAPPADAEIFWDDVALMRREHRLLPYFAAIAALMPKIILIDFTHQLIDRDYTFQTVLEGQRWSDIKDQLTPEENISLWRQCGEIVRRIHATTGGHFGYPYPVGAFTKWSEMVLDRFSRISDSLDTHQLEIRDFKEIIEIVSKNAAALDEVQTPHLLHGDLWTFNLMVGSGSDGLAITGVLDTDRAWWGDPLADWIVFLLSLRQENSDWKPRCAAFYDGYGLTPTGGEMEFRQEIYKAMHIGLMAVWGAKNGEKESITRARRDLDAIARSLVRKS